MFKNKFVLFVIIYLLFSINYIKADIPIILEIHNVIKNSGIIYAGIYSNEKSYKDKKPEQVIQIKPINTIVSIDLMLPDGEYVINAYQDINGNGKLDQGIFFIPKEPVGITNWNGKGIPGNFNLLKVIINNMTGKIIINIYKL
ncbi:MAG: hypothetical protein EZS26_000133 [Candidatus Ordinivivax streblomastigis]|uniref:DUF2141 domain-containing protein n=1 Tax=Candidatus Ordinivivax streblomastigis TaxID=2540710 RepID=A0A5M8P5K2_9BACT|nr:MAG: hypothetical protein EZS26_000133 [Candidatus Ordinivivax streblomastigis]